MMPFPIVPCIPLESICPAVGLCAKGNIAPTSGKRRIEQKSSSSSSYHWTLSDQRGLGYASAKTHGETIRTTQDGTHSFTTSKFHVDCGATTGYLQTTTALYDEVNACFRQEKLLFGSDVMELQQHQVPKHQTILWSTYNPQPGASGWGVQFNWRVRIHKGVAFPHAFTKHTHSDPDQILWRGLQM